MYRCVVLIIALNDLTLPTSSVFRALLVIIASIVFIQSMLHFKIISSQREYLDHGGIPGVDFVEHFNFFLIELVCVQL